jgi:hypothetical protein
MGSNRTAKASLFSHPGKTRLKLAPCIFFSLLFHSPFSFILSSFCVHCTFFELSFIFCFLFRIFTLLFFPFPISFSQMTAGQSRGLGYYPIKIPSVWNGTCSGRSLRPCPGEWLGGRTPPAPTLKLSSFPSPGNPEALLLPLPK